MYQKPEPVEEEVKKPKKMTVFADGDGEDDEEYAPVVTKLGVNQTSFIDNSASLLKPVMAN